MTFHLTSASFTQGGEIPRRHTCQDEGVSPSLEWSGVPTGTRSLALIVDDPDAPDPKAPQRTFVHWVVYDIPPTASGLPAGVASEGLPGGAREGVNDRGRTGYTGPCPPIGRHRYFFKLYALDRVLEDLGAATKAQLEDAMKAHVITVAELMGTYQKT